MILIFSCFYFWLRKWWFLKGKVDFNTRKTHLENRCKGITQKFSIVNKYTYKTHSNSINWALLHIQLYIPSIIIHNLLTLLQYLDAIKFIYLFSSKKKQCELSEFLTKNLLVVSSVICRKRLICLCAYYFQSKTLMIRIAYTSFDVSQ